MRQQEWAQRDERNTGDPFHQISELLGGPNLLNGPLRSALDAHRMIREGFPGEALQHLVGTLEVLKDSVVLEQGIGISVRTYQRQRNEEGGRLSLEQSSRTYKFAEILTKAILAFGSRADAEAWLMRPALGLNQNAPIDLMETSAGLELVETYLTQIEYGVYV
nr:antitoxin Xre/MbcA/ParS toxin-binding domain-containing protein [Aquabacter cavernae]